MMGAIRMAAAWLTCSTSSVALAWTRLAWTRLAIALVAVGLLVIPRPGLAEQRMPTNERLVRALVAQLGPGLQQLATEQRSLAWALRYRIQGGKRDRFERVLRGRLEAELAAARMAGLTRLPTPIEATRADLRQAAQASGADRLLVIHVEISGNHVQLVGELYDVVLTFWGRVRRPVTGMRAHFFARQRLDAELRSLLDLKAAPATSRFELPATPDGLPGNGLSAAVGDVDGDGLQELALLTATGVTVVRIVGEELTPVAGWRTDSVARTTHSSRDRFGTIVAADVTGDGRDELAVWTTDLLHGRILTWRAGQLVPLRTRGAGKACGRRVAARSAIPLCGPALGALPALGPQSIGPSALYVGGVKRGRNHLTPDLMVWSSHQQVRQPAAGVYWTLSALAAKQARPGEYTDLVVAVDELGMARVRGGGQTWKAPGVGTAAVLVDFEDDGVVELVTSSDAWPGGTGSQCVVSTQRAGLPPSGVGMPRQCALWPLVMPTMTGV
ncbi:MAG: hypothetical protein ACI9WU_000709 [Myxococcota bacterium]|jgi:hypothetical protein